MASGDSHGDEIDQRTFFSRCCRRRASTPCRRVNAQMKPARPLRAFLAEPRGLRMKFELHSLQRRQRADLCNQGSATGHKGRFFVFSGTHALRRGRYGARER
jgi:hypothetical protein